MCGIVGVAGDINQDAEKAFKMMLVLDVLRGEDSTGIVSVGKYNNAEVRVAKALGHPFNLFETKPYDKAMAQSHRVLLGHNRYATSGGISRMSAHPFEFDSVVGVHNGTLTNKHELLDADRFKVDSENLYHVIDKRGADEAIKSAAGAWALVWWDKGEDVLRIIRNKERPLFICESDDGKQIFWASEMWMLYAALGRVGIKHSSPFQIKEDMLHTWKIGNGGKLDKVLVRELKGKEVAHSFFTDRGATGKAGTTRGTTTETSRKVIALPGKKKTDVQAGAHKLLNPDAKYMGREGVLFQKIGDYFDDYGASYVECFDIDNPSYNIRLYVHSQHGIETKPVNTMFRGNISGYTAHEGGYYKVSPWTISDVEPPSEQLHKNHKGVMVSAEEWEKTYGSCAFCEDQVTASDSAYVILTTSGQCLCKGCSQDTEITALVSAANTSVH